MNAKSQDKSHCFKHACSHPANEECPHCVVERIVERVLSEVIYVGPKRFVRPWVNLS